MTGEKEAAVRRLPEGWQCRVVRGWGDGTEGVVYTSPPGAPYASRRGAAKGARHWIKRQQAEASPWKRA